MCYTTEDYFKYDGYDCPAGYRAQEDIDWLSEEFDRFLGLIECERTYDSEWYYSSKHSGIHATPTTDVEYFIPREVDEFGCDSYLEIWKASYPRLRAMYEYLERANDHLNEAPYDYWYGFVRKRDVKLDHRRDIVLGEYEKEVDRVLEELCDAYEKNLKDACDWAYSDEAAEEWVKYKNEEAA